MQSVPRRRWRKSPSQAEGEKVDACRWWSRRKGDWDKRRMTKAAVFISRNCVDRTRRPVVVTRESAQGIRVEPPPPFRALPLNFSSRPLPIPRKHHRFQTNYRDPLAKKSFPVFLLFPIPRGSLSRLSLLYRTATKRSQIIAEIRRIERPIALIAAYVIDERFAKR